MANVSVRISMERIFWFEETPTQVPGPLEGITLEEDISGNLEQLWGLGKGNEDKEESKELLKQGEEPCCCTRAENQKESGSTLSN